MILSSWGISDIGNKRLINEDFFFTNDQHHLYVIADGMGGHAGGEYASKIAVMTVKEIMTTARTSEPFKKYFDKAYISDDHEHTLKNSLLLASTKIALHAAENVELKGMGTTCVGLFIEGTHAYVAYVGDSRLYLLRNTTFSQLTDDHSLVNEQLKMGIISKEEAARHAFKNIITRSIGVTENVDVDSFQCTIQKDDIFMLATDGLSNMLQGDEIKKILLEHDIQTAVRKLISQANAYGGDDNVTVVLIKVMEI